MNKLSEAQLGIFYALGAYLIWGVAPLYFKHLGFIPVYEILAHRVIWSVVVTALLVSYLKDWSNVISVCRSYKSLLMLTITSLLISCYLVFFLPKNYEEAISKTTIKEIEKIESGAIKQLSNTSKSLDALVQQANKQVSEINNLKQYIDKLIKRNSLLLLADSGQITILDKRVKTKRYGKGLLDALPPFNIQFEQHNND